MRFSTIDSISKKLRGRLTSGELSARIKLERDSLSTGFKGMAGSTLREELYAAIKKADD